VVGETVRPAEGVIKRWNVCSRSRRGQRVTLETAVRLTADVADGADEGAEMTQAGAGENLTRQVHGASYPSS
jgi:hypothetical protein